MGSRRAAVHGGASGRAPAWGAACLALCAWLSGCVHNGGTEVASSERCIASCSKPAPDGEACLEWAALTSSTCIARFSAVDQCCGPGDRPLCAVAAPVSIGSACICRGIDRHGPFVVQGSACRPG